MKPNLKTKRSETPLSLFQLFSCSVEGFLSVHEAGVSVLSLLRGRMTLQELCRVHPVLGPVFGLLPVGGSLWLFARLCGAVLIWSYKYESQNFIIKS